MHHKTPSFTSVLVLFSLLFSTVFSSKDLPHKNRPAVLSIESPDGDIIDCVLFHLQPAFDLPELRGETSPITLPELPKGQDDNGVDSEIKQLWNSKGESCPDGTIPIRRTNGTSNIRSISTSKFQRKFSRKDIPEAPSHEHALGYVTNGKFWGANTRLNVWEPNVIGYDFSITQIWVLTDIPGRLANNVEAGWHVYPDLYKNNHSRLFTYWTPNGYKSGCYNLHCPGFVQISKKVALGAAIAPISTYKGQQYDIAYMIWKDPKTTNWWLQVANELVGYWPSSLFTDLNDHATTIEYGGEVYSENIGKHTSTQMGSGHFPEEGFGKAGFARNLEVVDQNNHLVAVSNLNLLAEKPNCYNVNKGKNDVWGNYIFFGGPGNNPKCT